MSGNRNTHDATFTSTDSPQSTDYTNFEFSELLEFDEWAEEDLITMVSGYPMNLSGENGAAGNNNYIGTSSRLEAPDDSKQTQCYFFYYVFDRLITANHYD